MNEVENLKQIEELKRIVLKKILSKEAFERLARIRLVKPELAAQIELYLIQLYQQNKIKSEIKDEQLKLILESLSSRRDFKIIK
ncbi:MAG: DNA-binding protein [Candidatus Aenigmatarchaeota archaeon]